MSALSHHRKPAVEFLLLIRGTHWSRGLPAAERERVLTGFCSWVDGLVLRGVHRAAQPLGEEGKVVSGAKGATVTDGDFAESREAVASCFLLAVSGMEEAVRLAQECPVLAHGAQIEVRPVTDICRSFTEAGSMSDDWSEASEDTARL